MDLEKRIDALKEIDGLNSEQLDRIKCAYSALENLFGETWFRETPIGNHPYIRLKKSKRGHPLLGRLDTQVPWTQLWIAGFVDDIMVAKSGKNFQVIIDKLKAEDRFWEGYSEMTIAIMFLKAGHKVEFIPLEGEGKKPDLIVRNGNEILEVEVTEMGQSDDIKDALAIFPEIHTKDLIKSGIEIGGTIHNSSEGKEDILKIIRNALNDVIKSGGCKYYRKWKKFDLCIYEKELIEDIPIEYRTLKILFRLW